MASVLAVAPARPVAASRCLFRSFCKGLLVWHPRPAIEPSARTARIIQDYRLTYSVGTSLPEQVAIAEASGGARCVRSIVPFLGL